MGRSAAAYDAGDESEARRLANSIRLLVKHLSAGQTKSLLHQLGLLESLRFIDTCGRMDPRNMLTESPMVLIELNTHRGSRYKPRLGLQGPWGAPKALPFEEWWTMPVIRVQPGPVEFSRSELVLNIAEQDGGTHVDPHLNAKYAALSRANSAGWVVTHSGVTAPLRPIELAHVRQIAYEVLTTLGAT